MSANRLHVDCPACSATLIVDAATGEVISHRQSEEPAGGGHDFDQLLDDLDEQKSRAEAIFEREQAAHRDRERLLAEKFEEAMKRAKEEPDDEPPLRPWDLD